MLKGAHIMSMFAKCWKIGGVIAGPVTRNGVGGSYSVIFERENGATLEKIEGIAWAKPAIEELPGNQGRSGLPEDYGFDLKGILYHHETRHFEAVVTTARQYLGDVTGYQAKIDELTAENAERGERIGTLEQELAEADETAIALYEALEAGTGEEAAV